jgi:peptidoglycan hydrolase CwlO-like protein
LKQNRPERTFEESDSSVELSEVEEDLDSEESAKLEQTLEIMRNALTNLNTQIQTIEEGIGEIMERQNEQEKYL